MSGEVIVGLGDGKGRIAAVEMLLMNDTAAGAIRAAKPLDLGALVLEPGGAGIQTIQTMDMALEKLVGERLITPETALDRAVDKDAFLKLGGKPKPP